jgi:hypothetical protein
MFHDYKIRLRTKGKKKMWTVVQLAWLNAAVLLALGGGLNTVLGWAIWRHTPAEMRAYRQILAQTMTMDMAYILLFFFLLPVSSLFIILVFIFVPLSPSFSHFSQLFSQISL